MNEQSLRELWTETIGLSDDADPTLSYRPTQDLAGKVTLTPVAETVSMGVLDLTSEGQRIAADPALQVDVTLDDSATTTTTTTPQVGQGRLAGFKIVDELGRGGMGVVYQAVQTRLRRRVAVKTVSRHRLEESPGLRDKFRAEAWVTGHLDHPNIVPVYDLCSLDAGEDMLAMKLVGGKEWKALLAARDPTERREDLEYHIGILLSVCNAVAYAHSKGIAHLDLKPANVMVGDFGEVLVMDWGLAVDVRPPEEAAADQRAPHCSQLTAPAGTPSYMPPELAEGRGSDVGPWTDVYLLGAVLHRIVTGSPPHKGSNIWEVLTRSVRSTPPTFSDDVPRELQELCRRAMARDPEARPGSVSELREALEGYLEHRESLVISAAASRALSEVADTKVGTAQRKYARFAEAVAGFQQARALWEESPEARTGEAQARLAFAEAALHNGDVGLAEAQAEALQDPSAEDLRSRIAEVKLLRARADRNARRIRIGLYSSIAAAVTILTTGVVLVDRENKKYLEQRNKYLEQRDEYLEQRDEALSQRNRARIATQREQRQRDQAERRLASSLIAQGDSLALGERWYKAKLCYREARGVLTQLGASTRPADLPLARAWLCAPPPTLALSLPTGVVNDLELGALDRRLLVATSQVVELWDPVTGRRLRTMRGHTKSVRCVSLAPTGKTCASGSYDGTVRSWDLETGKELWSQKTKTPVTDMAFLPQGQKLLISLQDSTLRLLDAQNGTELRSFKGHTGSIESLALGPDGKTALSGSMDNTVRLWDLETGKELHRHDLRQGGIQAVAISADGQRFLAGSLNGSVRLWEVRGSEVQHLKDHQGHVTAVRFLPAGQRALSSSTDGTVKLWDLNTGEVLRTYTAELKLHAIAISRGGEAVLAAGMTNRLEVWRLPGEEPEFAMPDRLAYAVAISPDQRWIVGGGMGPNLMSSQSRLEKLGARLDGSPWDTRAELVQKADQSARRPPLKLWDAKTGQALHEFSGAPGVVTAIAFSPDSARLLAGGLGLTLWDVASGKQLRTLGGSELVLTVAFSPDGRQALAGGRQVKVWDLETGRCLRTVEQSDTMPGSLAFSPDGTRFLVGAAKGGVRLVDLESGGTRALEESSVVTTLAFRPDSHQALGVGVDGMLRTWDLRSGRRIFLHQVLEPTISTLAVSGDGALALVGGRSDRLSLYDLEAGGLPCRFPSQELLAVSFASDREVLLGGRTIEHWDLSVASRLGRPAARAPRTEPLDATGPRWGGSTPPRGSCVGPAPAWRKPVGGESQYPTSSWVACTGELET